jgi:hypothetical protein
MGLSTAARADEAQSLQELRNTVINLLDGLVQKGVLTKEQAQAMVKDAQEKSAAQAKEKSAQEVAEKDAVRVTYIPETVRKQISDQVSAELEPEVTKAVVAQAKEEQWGVPGALPEWIGRLAFYGDIRLRTQSDMYADANYVSSTPPRPDDCLDRCYYDFQTINLKGGVGKAGTAAILNTTNDRLRERLRLRVGLAAKLTDGITAGVRLATGDLTNPVSMNQLVGVTGARYTFAVDQAYLRFDTNSAPEVPWMTAWLGRIPNPFYSSDLVWYSELQFEGFADTLRWNFDGSQAEPKNLFFTAGAFPVQEIELSSKDKWLYGAQLGLDWTFASGVRTRVAAAYYYFDNIAGTQNAPDSTLLDYTAPQFMQKGNTVFDIRNDTDPTTNLFALAANYHLADVTVGVDWPAFNHRLSLTADYVKNIGFDQAEIFARTGSEVGKRNVGYQVEFGFGTNSAMLRGNWRAAIEYRYLQRDAVVDAFTDSDFHLGGTDTKGYVIKGDWWFRDRSYLSLRYLSSDEIDGATPYGIDTLWFDVNGQF